MRRAVTYTRISKDAAGQGLGVARQLDACEELCRRNGWRVVDRLSDNDLSAYRRKPRPGYRELLRQVAAGEVDVVVAWAADRLTRRLIELIELHDVLSASGVEVATVQSGRIDLTSPGGLMQGRMMGVVAEYESHLRSERVKAKARQLAEAGRNVTGGPIPPYGFEADRVTVNEDQAAEVRRWAREVGSGASLYAVCQDLNERGVPAPAAETWNTTTIRNVLTSARTAGFRQTADGELHRAEWPAILDEATWRHVRAVLATRTRPRTPPRRYLLTGGLAVCGECGHPLHSAPRAGRVRGMGCLRVKGGCGKVHVLAEPVEELVERQVLAALDGPGLDRALVRYSAADAQAQAAAAEVAAIKAHRKRVVADYGHQGIDRETFKELLATIDADLAEAEERLGKPNPADVLGGPGLAERWPAMGLAQRRAVLDLVLKQVAVDALTEGPRNRFRPERVHVTWLV